MFPSNGEINSLGPCLSLFRKKSVSVMPGSLDGSYDNSVLIAGDPHGILGQQLRPHPIYLLNIIIFTLNTN